MGLCGRKNVAHFLLNGSPYMPILTVILVIVVVGVLLWALNSFVPMDSKVRSILNIVVVLLLIIWLLQAFGLISHFGNVRVG
jgi:hypothetical protein